MEPVTFSKGCVAWVDVHAMQAFEKRGLTARSGGDVPGGEVTGQQSKSSIII